MATQAEHDHQYSPKSKKARENLSVSVVQYGSQEDERMEIAKPESASDSIEVGDRPCRVCSPCSMADSLFMAIPLVSRGATVAAVEYTLAPKANMTLIVDQCVRAVRHVHVQFPSHSIYLLGHSAGGHLAAYVLAALAGEPIAARIIGVCSVSGLFDLQPVQRCYANEALRLTDAEVAALSPSNMVAQLAQTPAKILLVIAERDPTAFREHSLSLHAALLKAGAQTELVDYAGLDHFNAIEKLCESDYALVARILAACGL